MIVRSRPNPVHLFLILQGSILPRIMPQILVVFFFSMLVVWIERGHPAIFHSYTAAPFTLLGIALSVFLGFRNNACYDRWWEARRQWGQLTIDMRCFARTVTTLLPGHVFGDRMIRSAIAFTYALNAHLQQRDLPAEVAHYLTESDFAAAQMSRNPPDQILRILGRDLAGALREGEITDILYKAINENLTAIAGVQGGCERILSTPVPFTYTLLLHRSSSLFCLLLPFGLNGTFSYATPIFCALIAYSFFGLDALGDELEEPFRASANGMPLHALSRTIEINLLEALGETSLPPALLPVDYILH